MPLSSKAKRLLWRAAALAVVLLILILLIVLLQLDTIIRKGIEFGGGNMLHVQTQLKEASVSLLHEKVTLTGLNVANPEGFANATFVQAQKIVVSAQIGGLLKHQVHLYEVTLEAPEFDYEVPSLGGQTNVDVLMDNLNSAEKTPGRTNQPPRKPIRLRIDLLRVTNARVHVVYLGQHINISLPEIELSNLDDGHGNGIPPDQILGALLANITGSVGAQLAGLGKGGFEFIEKNAPKAGALGEQGEKGTLKKAENEAEKAAGAIKGLFGK